MVVVSFAESQESEVTVMVLETPCFYVCFVNVKTRVYHSNLRGQKTSKVRTFALIGLRYVIIITSAVSGAYSVLSKLVHVLVRVL